MFIDSNQRSLRPSSLVAPHVPSYSLGDLRGGSNLVPSLIPQNGDCLVGDLTLQANLPTVASFLISEWTEKVCISRFPVLIRITWIILISWGFQLSAPFWNSTHPHLPCLSSGFHFFLSGREAISLWRKENDRSFAGSMEA